MSDTFQLPVTYNGEEKEFPAQLLRFGYTHKVHVSINGITVIFEPDEEQHYRAVADPDANVAIPVALLEAVSQTLQALFE